MKFRANHSPEGRTPARVIVVGGGLAGMAAAVALESAGLDVTLIEARKTLGGRAGSFEEPQTGEELDNCQHVLLGCCTNLLDFYHRLGVSHLIQWERTVHFVDGDGRRFDLYGTKRLPAPLHLGPSMAHFGALTWDERFAFSRAMIAMMTMGRAGREKLATTSFGHWLDEHRQPPTLVRKMYDPILVSALNEGSRHASAAYAIQVFQEAMLANAAGYVIGLPNCPLSQLYARLPLKDLRLGTRVKSLVFEDGGVTGVELASGETVTADAVVLATNHHAVRRWVPPALAAKDSRFDHLDELEDVPILGVHLWFDRPVMTQTHAALIEGPLQWLFRKDATGRSVHGVISAARDWTNRSKEESLAQFEAQVRRTLPAARDATLERGVVVVEKRATFSPVAGVDRLRPSQEPPAGGIGHLFLAGDYTATGWPATMEGAVRSGYLAAEAVARRLLEGRTRFIVNDLPTQWPARLMGL
jgi:squalene-associated FAD-dependent desaturase